VGVDIAYRYVLMYMVWYHSKYPPHPSNMIMPQHDEV